MRFRSEVRGRDLAGSRLAEVAPRTHRGPGGRISEEVIGICAELRGNWLENQVGGDGST